MDKSSSLGMPMSPQVIFKKYKRQSLGMPKASPLHQQNTRSSFTCYIFIASYVMCCSWSFFFCFVLYLVINTWITAFLCGRETRSTLLHHILHWSETRSTVLHHIYFGVRHAPLFCIRTL